MKDFHSLETPVNNLANVAQILAALFEDVQFDGEDGARLTKGECEMIGFLIYDLCVRTKKLDDDLQTLLRTDFAARRAAA